MAATASLRLLAVAVALTGVLVLTVPGTAMAAKPCWKQIIDDWYKNERIDGSYPQKCYDEAEKNLPQDLRDYSDLPAEIARARQRDLRGQPADPGKARRVVQSVGPTATSNDDNNDGNSGSGKTADDGKSASGGPIDDLLEAAGPSSADSPPIPLLVLAGLALLLVAAGGAGLLSRRLQARRARTGPPTDPQV
jgi:hypothetical protein